MIATNELRIGNFIYWNQNQVFKISGITKAGCRFENDHNQFRTHKRILPIPITPEILKMCGFCLDGEGWYYLIKKNHITPHGYSFNIYGNFFEIEELRISKIEYLHQLQNLYFYLTGNELQYGTKNI